MALSSGLRQNCQIAIGGYNDAANIRREACSEVISQLIDQRQCRDKEDNLFTSRDRRCDLEFGKGRLSGAGRQHQDTEVPGARIPSAIAGVWLAEMIGLDFARCLNHCRQVSSLAPAGVGRVTSPVPATRPATWRSSRARWRGPA